MTIPPNGPLGYLNNLQATIPWVSHAFAPTTANTDFTIPTLWVNSVALDYYLLVDKALGVATWIKSSGAAIGPLDTLTGTTGGAVSPNVAGNISFTSTAGTLVIAGTPGSNSINFDLSGGSVAFDSFTPDSGTSPVVPTAGGAVTMAGSGSITTVGGTNTLTTQLTGLTNHAILVGAGTTTITKIGPTATAGQVLQSAGAAADPVFSTATYPSTTTVSQVLYSSGTNAINGLPTANNGVLLTNGSGVPSIGNTLGAGFTYTTSVAGATTLIQILNTDNTNAGSHSLEQIKVGGTSGGDPYTTYASGTSRAYGIGIDNQSSGQPFSVSTAANDNVRPGAGTKLLNITAAGVPSFPQAGWTTDGALYSAASGVISSTSAPTAGTVLTETGLVPTFSTTVTGTGSFTFQDTTAGDKRNLFSYHTDGTNTASHAVVAAVTTGSGGNPFMAVSVAANRFFSYGIIQSDSNALQLLTANNSTITAGATVYRMSTSGAQTVPLQPSFGAYQNGDVSNVTGDSTNYTIIFGNELFDRASNYDNTTGVFTAPVTGIYQFSCMVLYLSVIAAGQCLLQLVTTARPYTFGAGGTSLVGNVPLGFSVAVPMTAGDAAHVVAQVGNMTKVVGIYGTSSGDVRTYFSGVLLC